MIRKTLALLVISIFFWAITPIALADIGEGVSCNPNGGEKCIDGYSCLPGTVEPINYYCQRDAFGKIQPPPALSNLLKNDQTGEGAISDFLSRLIILIYTAATIVLIFMLLWGAFDWLTSGGEKEKLAAAQNKIMSAIIGILLFAVAFAIIAVLGQFTGFTFFTGQGGAPSPSPALRGPFPWL